MTTLQDVLAALGHREWVSLRTLAERLRCPVSTLWDPLVERPNAGLVRRAERTYAMRVHRHQMTTDGIWLADPHTPEPLCPRCRAGAAYVPSPWAIWDSPHCYPTADAARDAVAAHIRAHSGWHSPRTIAEAWHIPVSAILVRGTDNTTIGTFLGRLDRDPAFVVHRHVRIVGDLERVESWAALRTPGLPEQCPGCDPADATVYCPRCGARVASEADLIDRIQGFHGSRGLTSWHLDPPGCTACVPAGWSNPT